MVVSFLKLSEHFSKNSPCCPQAEVVLHSFEGLIHSFGGPKDLLSKQIPPDMDSKWDISDSKIPFWVRSSLLVPVTMMNIGHMVMFMFFSRMLMLV